MKWAVLLCGVVVTWLLNSVYIMFLVKILHSWYSQLPTMGWHTSVILSGLIVVAVIAGRFIGAFTGSVVKDI